MLTGHFDKEGNEIRVGDKWKFLNVIYTVVKEDDEIYFEHPSPWAGNDDDIEIEHSLEGLIVDYEHEIA